MFSIRKDFEVSTSPELTSMASSGILIANAPFLSEKCPHDSISYVWDFCLYMIGFSYGVICIASTTFLFPKNKFVIIPSLGKAPHLFLCLPGNGCQLLQNYFTSVWSNLLPTDVILALFLCGDLTKMTCMLISSLKGQLWLPSASFVRSRLLCLAFKASIIGLPPLPSSLSLQSTSNQSRAVALHTSGHWGRQTRRLRQRAALSAHEWRKCASCVSGTSKSILMSQSYH